MKLLQSISLVAAVLAAVACSSPEQGSGGGTDTIGFDTKFTSDSSGAPKDAAAKDGTPSSDGTAAETATTGGAAAILTFEVDDSANKTFGDGEIVWTGSFSWDSKTNTVVYATSWLPTDGPYPALYDDGPQSAGGHEREGATKGDHVFSTQVKFVASADTTFEYGALNELGNWMWVGPNGQVQVAKGTTGVVAFKGMKLPAHGKLDLKIALDTAKLNSKFAKWNLKDYALFVKGSMNMWTPIQLLDDGKKGDDKAGDGVVTYQHLGNLGKHDGGLSSGDEAQFIFVATQGDQLPDAGLEYKGATEAFKDGVQAWTNTGAGGAWVPAEVVLSKDSKGKFLNTAVVIPAASAGGCAPNCPCTPACKADETCKDGKCVANPPPACNPPCDAGSSCVQGKCVAQQSKPAIFALDPVFGATAGGDTVALVGEQFKAGAVVLFGAATATAVQVESGGKSLTCKTPAHAAGKVDVEVKNPDGGKALLAAGFEFKAPPTPAVVLSGIAASGVVAAGTVAVQATVAIEGVTSGAGITPDLTVQAGVAAAGSDPAKQPEKFAWQPLAYAEKDGKGGETFAGKLALAPGKYALAARATWQGATAYSLPVAVSATDPKDLPSEFSGVEPAFAPAKGGGIVKLLGINLQDTFAVSVAPSSGLPVTATVTANGDGTLTAALPAMPVGPAQISVASKDGKAIGTPKPIYVAPITTVSVDAAIGSDWPPSSKLASNSVATAWGAGKNELSGLWIAFDKANLYVGVNGTCETANAIAVYLDVDYGAATGVKAPVELQDNTGAVDDAIASAVKGADSQLGLDFAWATVGMASFDGADLAKSTGAGWRGLQKVNDFAWLAGTVKAGSGQVEAAIPLATLFPQGIAAGGAEVRIFAVLGNANGAAISNQWLPEQKSPPDAVTFTTAASFKVFAVP